MCSPNMTVVCVCVCMCLSVNKQTNKQNKSTHGQRNEKYKQLINRRKTFVQFFNIKWTTIFSRTSSHSWYGAAELSKTIILPANKIQTNDYENNLLLRKSCSSTGTTCLSSTGSHNMMVSLVVAHRCNSS